MLKLILLNSGCRPAATNTLTPITSESYLLIYLIYSLPLTTCQIGVSIRLTVNCYMHFV
jgi:hypothetical protein